MADYGRIAGAGIVVLAESGEDRGRIAGAGIAVLAESSVSRGRIAGVGIAVLVVGPPPQARTGVWPMESLEAAPALAGSRLRRRRGLM